MATRRRWYALILLVLWLSYYDHCAAPHAHCSESAGMCAALCSSLSQVDAERHHDDAPGEIPCAQSDEHGPVLTMGSPSQWLPEPATFALPEWMQSTMPSLVAVELDTLPEPPADNSSPPFLERLTMALPVRGPSL